MIVSGYAFTKCDLGTRVFNLNRPGRAAVLSRNGEMLETNMDEIELSLVENYFRKNKKFMEDQGAEVL
ncbi:MAG: hypothetical protein LUE29_05420 [Lachnospiraceae bacterium]|nr:hypothetical protein [Lachnospiraceae bacterium]